MAQSNPYATPKAQVNKDPEYGDVKVFSTGGRIGRVRYIGYTMGLSILIMMVIGMLTGVLGATVGAGVALPVMGIGYIVTFVLMIMLTIQRAHDFNASGWMSLLVFVPLVNLIFWFIPGTKGENRFGLQTPPNGVGAVLLALILPLVFVIGIVAAIAIPAYQDYVKRAQAQVQQPAPNQ